MQSSRFSAWRSYRNDEAWVAGGSGVKGMTLTSEKVHFVFYRPGRCITRARSKPAPARAAQSNSEKGSGTLLTSPDEDEDEDRRRRGRGRGRGRDEVEDEVVDGSSVIVMGEVCDDPADGVITES